MIGLLSWAKLLDLEVVSAGKSSEYDFIYDRVHGTVPWRGEAIAVPDFADVWLMPEFGVTETIDVRSEMLRMFPQRTVPDLCEMGFVCNHTGLLPDDPSFHAPQPEPSRCRKYSARRTRAASCRHRVPSMCSTVCAAPTNRALPAACSLSSIARIGIHGRYCRRRASR